MPDRVAGRVPDREIVALSAGEGEHDGGIGLVGDLERQSHGPAGFEIRALGGEAIANPDDVADWEGAQRLVNAAVEEFGDLDILVNNAGILRDRVIVNMTEGEWDAVVKVHLKGHFAPTRWAAAYWREQHKAGQGKPRNLVHTSSTSGLFANPGQANYGAAKTGIATFSQIAAKQFQTCPPQHVLADYLSTCHLYLWGSRSSQHIFSSKTAVSSRCSLHW